MNNEKVLKIKEELQKDKENIKSLKELNDLKVKYLGKKGLISELSIVMKDLPNDEKKILVK